MTSSVTTIDLLRHGQTQADDILRGRIDVPLSENGYRQMHSSISPYLTSSNPSIRSTPWQQLVTSPLQRCARFAGDLNEQYGTPLITDDGFLEMDFGDWDGRSFEDIEAENPDLFSKIWLEPHKYHPPNGETFHAFSDRIISAWDSLLKQHQGEHILLVCHGGVIRVLLANIMQTPLTSLSRIDVPFACFSRTKVHHQPGKPPWPQLISHNPQ